MLFLNTDSLGNLLRSRGLDNFDKRQMCSVFFPVKRSEIEKVELNQMVTKILREQRQRSGNHKRAKEKSQLIRYSDKAKRLVFLK